MSYSVKRKSNAFLIHLILKIYINHKIFQLVNLIKLLISIAIIRKVIRFKIHKKIAGFKPNARLDAADLYALTFLPGRAKREILTDSSEKYYKHNKGLDLDRDGKITKTELAARINQKRVNESIFS